MTQQELAEHLGISFQAVSSWERGNAMPDIAKLPELARMFSVTVDWLIGSPDAVEDRWVDQPIAQEATPVVSVDAVEMPAIAAGAGQPAIVAGAAHPVLPPHVGACPPPPVQVKDGPHAVHSLPEVSDASQEQPEAEKKPRVPLDLQEIQQVLPFMDEDDVATLARRAVEEQGSDAVGMFLPFMDEDDVAALARHALEEQGSDAMSMFLPFMDEDDVDTMARKAQEQGGSIGCFLPFMSEDQVGAIAKARYRQNGVESIGEFLPFMDEDDVDTIAKDVAAKGGDVQPLLPFATKEVISEIAQAALALGDVESLKVYAPFMDDDDLTDIACQQARTNGLSSIAPFLPFLDESTIKNLIWEKYNL